MASDGRLRFELHQARRPREVAGGQRVPDGLGRLPVPLVPRARPPVEEGYLVGLFLPETPAEDVGEEVVVAVPAAAVVEGNDEQVPALQRLEHGLAAVLRGD